MAFTGVKALLLDETHPFLEADLAAAGLDLVRDFSTPLAEFPSTHFQVEVLVIRSRMPVNADFLRRFPKLRVIGRLGAGLENIDLEQAQRQDITCLRVPEGNARAVAEHALGMLLSLLNHLPRVQREIATGQWLRAPNKGRELQSLKVGIIGYGVMGGEFARLLDAMGVQVLAYDKYKTGYADGSIQEVTLAQLQEEVDVVSLHLPLTEETRYFANAAFFSNFGRPVHFINTARGPITCTADLLQGLTDGTVLSASLDVLEYEKASFTSLFAAELPAVLRALLEREDVLLSPHIAGWTKESFEKMGRGLAAKIIAAL
jgi:D-3-phosphoglycerate dehydrogenase / 2-oxoglutarate reductase